MVEKSDSREEQMRGVEVQSPPELSVASEIAHIRRTVGNWFEAPKRELPFLERFLYGWLGSATFFVIHFYITYYAGERAVKLVEDELQIFSFLSGVAALSVCGILFALVVSSVRGRSGPVRLYFRGFLVVYVPWLLLSQWI